MREPRQEMMETQQQIWKCKWRWRFSFKKATFFICFFNLVTALFLLHRFFSPHLPISAQLRYLKESDEIRRALQPLELIQRVREIEQEAYEEPETVQHNEMKQTAALDLSKRLTNNVRSYSDGASLKALEEWRKRKMERARQRELGRNATSAS